MRRCLTCRVLAVGLLVLGLLATTACTVDEFPPGTDEPSASILPDSGGYNVADFGAVGDGVVDDHAAIQGAINAAATGGGEVLLPPGIYEVDSSLRVWPGISLQGQDATIRLGEVNPRVLLLGSDSTVLGLSVDGAGLASHVIEVGRGSVGAEIVDCEVYGHRAEQSGVYTASDAADLAIRDCSIHDVKNGIQLSNGPERVVIEGSHIANWTTRGIRIQGDRTAAASDIIIRGNRVGPNVDSGKSRQPVVSLSYGRVHRRISVLHNVVTGRGTAHEDPTAPGTADQISVNDTRGVRIVGNVSRLGGDRGISVSGSSQVILTGNRVTGSDTAGIGIGSPVEGNAVSRVTVRGNTVLNSGQARQGAGPADSLAAVLLSQVHGATVVGNVLSDSQERPTQKYGVLVGRSSNIDVWGNMFSGNAVMDVFDEGRNTGLRVEASAPERKTPRVGTLHTSADVLRLPGK